MRSRILFVALLTATISTSGSALQRQAPQGPVVEVYKDPTCGCCTNWVKHLQDNGFVTKVMEVSNLADIKSEHKIPSQAQSCHTATVDGYVVEGHVPAADVRRLLKERPAVLGLAVPGMPIGSPGMKVPNVKPSPYNVVTFDQQGQLKVFASH